MPTPDQPTGMNELRNLLFEVWRNGRDQDDRYVSVDETEAAIQQIVERCLGQDEPEMEGNTHMVSNVTRNKLRADIRHNLQQAGLLRGDELTQKPAEETEAQ